MLGGGTDGGGNVRGDGGHQRTLDQTEISPFTLIEAAGAVSVEVVPMRAFKKVVVRPLSKGVKPQVADGKITLTLPGAGHYTVELDGTHEALQLFVNAPKDYGIDTNAAGVRYSDRVRTTRG